jgi:hypothetical protein
MCTDGRYLFVLVYGAQKVIFNEALYINFPSTLTDYFSSAPTLATITGAQFAQGTPAFSLLPGRDLPVRSFAGNGPGCCYPIGQILVLS